MPNNPKRPGACAGQTFRADEIAALEELFALLSRGADASVVMRSEPITRVRRKIATMRESIKRQLATRLIVAK